MTRSTDIQAAIATINNLFREIVQNGSENGTSALYSRAGLALPEKGNFECDKETIQTFWQSVMDLGIKDAKLETLALEGNGNTTIEVSEDEGTTTITKREFGLTWD